MASRHQAYGEETTVTPLYLFRHLRRWTQRELAERSGLERVTVVLIEAGKRHPRVDTANKLARALGVPVEVLFPSDDQDGHAA